jgi:hypothetical protein
VLQAPQIFANKVEQIMFHFYKKNKSEKEGGT